MAQDDITDRSQTAAQFTDIHIAFALAEDRAAADAFEKA